MSLRVVASALPFAFCAVTSAIASLDDRGYDDAVTCKGLSLIAITSSHPSSRTAIERIDAVIAKNAAPNGRTREQADADIEYVRFEWKDARSQAEIDAGWVKCRDRWSKS